MSGLVKTNGEKMKKNAHPREVIGNRKSKCEREGKCIPEDNAGRHGYRRADTKCKICKRLMPVSKVA